MKLRSIYTRFYTKRRLDETKRLLRTTLTYNDDKPKILDLGSGNGLFVDVFREVGYKTVIAVDADKTVLAENKADKKVFSNLENSTLPFPDNHFDCVFAAEIIEHLDNRDKFLKEIHRVLKPNGHLFLTTPNKDSLICKFDRLIGRFTVNGWWNGHNSDHKYIYGYKEINNQIESHTFDILRRKGFYFFYGLPIMVKSTGMCTWVLAKKIAKQTK